MHANSSGCFTDADGSVHLSGLQTQDQTLYQKKCVTSTSVTKQDPLRPSQNRYPPKSSADLCLYKKNLIKGKPSSEKWENAGGKKGKQTSKIKKKKNLSMKSIQGLSSSSRAIDSILSHVLWDVLQILKPPPGGRSQLTPEKNTDPRPVRTRRVMTLSLSPPTNQKDVHKLIKTPQSPSHSVFKNLQSLWGVWVFQTLASYPELLTWRPALHTALFFTTTLYW